MAGCQYSIPFKQWHRCGWCYSITHRIWQVLQFPVIWKLRWRRICVGWPRDGIQRFSVPWWKWVWGRYWMSRPTFIKQLLLMKLTGEAVIETFYFSCAWQEVTLVAAIQGAGSGLCFLVSWRRFTSRPKGFFRSETSSTSEKRSRVACLYYHDPDDWEATLTLAAVAFRDYNRGGCL